MAFFVNPGKDWENNLTEEDIAKLEAQGCDVSGLRNRPPVPEDDDEEEEAFDNPTRLDRLKPYLQTPRDMETPFFRRGRQCSLVVQGSLEEEIIRSLPLYMQQWCRQQCFVETGRQRLLSGSVCFCPLTRSTFTMWNGYRKWQKRSANCQIVLLCRMIAVN